MVRNISKNTPESYGEANTKTAHSQVDMPMGVCVRIRQKPGQQEDTAFLFTAPARSTQTDTRQATGQALVVGKKASLEMMFIYKDLMKQFLVLKF